MEDTKKCPKCQEVKPLSKFHKQTDRKHRMTYCKSCFNYYCGQRWIQRKKDAIEYKGGKCVDCNLPHNDDNPYVLYDFHHLDPSVKDCDWRKLRLRSWDKIVIELDKCVCLCSTCHRRREHKERQSKMVAQPGLEPGTTA